MIHRMQLGEVPPKNHIAFRPGGKLAFEHCFTRQGFDGAYTIMYHREPPHWVATDEDLGAHLGIAASGWDGPLRRRHFVSSRQAPGGSPFTGRRLLLENADVAVYMVHADRDDEPGPKPDHHHEHPDLPGGLQRRWRSDDQRADRRREHRPRLCRVGSVPCG